MAENPGLKPAEIDKLFREDIIPFIKEAAPAFKKAGTGKEAINLAMSLYTHGYMHGVAKERYGISGDKRHEMANLVSQRGKAIFAELGKGDGFNGIG